MVRFSLSRWPPWWFVLFGLSSVVSLIECGVLMRRLVVSMTSSAALKIPAALKAPGIKAGAGLVTKTVFMSSLKVGTVSDIATGSLDPAPTVQLGIAGETGAVFANAQGVVQSAVTFTPPGDHVNIVDVEHDGVCEFLNRGSWGSQPWLLDHSGQVLWRYQGAAAADDTAPTTIRGTGKLDFVIGHNGRGGVTMLDAKGASVWNRPDRNVWHVETLDPNNDGHSLIVHSNAKGRITVRDAQGQVLSRAKAPFYFDEFAVCHWPTATGPQYLMGAANGTIWIVDVNGTAIKTLTAPNGGQFRHPYNTWVKLKANQAAYLAVLVEYEIWERSVLYLYDATGKLVYEEVLPEAGAALKAVAFNNASAETLLVGGVNQVWQYH